MNHQLRWRETATELDDRAIDEVEVAFLWTRATGRVAVCVLNRRDGSELEVEVLEHESPLDVFRHPYAYAALHERELLLVA
jgi:hypothetical protein